MRIMTTNIWGDYFNNPVGVREGNIYKIYENYKPDIIGFQEITSRWYNSNLFKRLADEYFFVGTELANSCNYVPLAIKKNYTVWAKGYELFSDTFDFSKGITWAVISENNDNKIFGVCNVHFWWKQDDPIHDTVRAKNAQQLSEIMKYISARFNCPVFAFGDMNCTRSSQVFNTVYPANGIKPLFDQAEIKDDISSHHGDPIADSDGNYHGKRTINDNTASIDHMISLGDGFKITQYRVVEDQYALDATDHSPVFADIDWRI